MVFFIMHSCQKETKPKIPLVNEFFAPKDMNIKQEIYHFLVNANRLPQASAKNNTTPILSDKEPNEGAWLMEAAINVERYGNLNKDVVETKTYTIDVSNKILPDGLVKMDAADIIIKYNALISAIIQDETNQKVANLIDLQVIEIKTDYTKIEVNVNFAYAVEPVVFQPETIVVPGSPSSLCQYQLPSGISYSPSLVYDFSSYPVTTSAQNQSYYSFEPGSIAYAYNETAKDYGFYYSTFYPNNTLGTTFLFSDGNTDFTPYTNIVIVFNLDIINNLDCATIIQQTEKQNAITSEYLFNYKTLTEEYKSFLPNNSNNSINYELVYGLLKDYQPSGYNYTANVRRLYVETLAYFHVSNQ